MILRTVYQWVDLLFSCWWCFHYSDEPDCADSLEMTLVVPTQAQLAPHDHYYENCAGPRCHRPHFGDLPFGNTFHLYSLGKNPQRKGLSSRPGGVDLKIALHPMSICLCRSDFINAHNHTALVVFIYKVPCTYNFETSAPPIFFNTRAIMCRDKSLRREKNVFESSRLGILKFNFTISSPLVLQELRYVPANKYLKPTPADMVLITLASNPALVMPAVKQVQATLASTGGSPATIKYSVQKMGSPTSILLSGSIDNADMHSRWSQYISNPSLPMLHFWIWLGVGHF